MNQIYIKNMTDLSKEKKNNEAIGVLGKTELLELDDDALIVVLNNCTLCELITLRKTCKKFYALISELPRYKKDIEGLKELYTSGILKITEDEEFLITLFEKNYSNMGHLLPFFWMPKYVKATDSSARTLSEYSKEINKTHVELAK